MKRHLTSLSGRIQKHNRHSGVYLVCATGEKLKHTAGIMLVFGLP